MYFILLNNLFNKTYDLFIVHLYNILLIAININKNDTKKLCLIIHSLKIKKKINI